MKPRTFFLLTLLVHCIAISPVVAQKEGFLFRSGFPASSARVERDVPGIEDIFFCYLTPYYQIKYDMKAVFPKETVEPFTVEKVFVNDVERKSFNVLNNGIFSRLQKANGNDNLEIYVEGGWEWGKEHTVRIEGKRDKGAPVSHSVRATAPIQAACRFVGPTKDNSEKAVQLFPEDLGIRSAEVKAVLYNGFEVAGHQLRTEGGRTSLWFPFAWAARTPYHFEILLKENSVRKVRTLGPSTEMTFAYPTVSFPFYSLSSTFEAGSFREFEIAEVSINGLEVRDFTFNDDGESKWDRVVTGKNPLTITAKCDWRPSTEYELRIVGKDKNGAPVKLVQRGFSPSSGGYWNSDWSSYIGVILTEARGVERVGEPVHLSVGVFKDKITKPEIELRVVEVNPTHKRFADTREGFPCVEIPSQVYHVSVFDDPEYIETVEYDSTLKKEIRRYYATTCFEVAFLADLKPYEQKLYLIFYGNSHARKPAYTSDLVVTGQGIGKTVENPSYRIKLDRNSGAFETIFVKQELDILLEHKLETNGAVHWNPDVYAPPLPWVHASDWEKPEFEEVSGPVFYMSRRYAPLPHITSVKSSVTYFFYPSKPYVIVKSSLELERDLDVKAIRNAEIVFNHEVLNEFVHKNRRGEKEFLKIEGSRPHPEHAIEISDKTPWLGFVNREKKIGFFGINLEYLNMNRFGGTPSTYTPYFYVANGPWIYMSRGLNYSFGSNNPGRLLKARGGSLFAEKIAYLPCRLGDKQSTEFQIVEAAETALLHPIDVETRMETDPRTSKQWIAPLLTAPFDEGVKGAAGAKRTGEMKK